MAGSASFATVQLSAEILLVDSSNVPPSMQKFDYSLDYQTIDFRQHPELYRIGRGEQGIFCSQQFPGLWLAGDNDEDSRGTLEGIWHTVTSPCKNSRRTLAYRSMSSVTCLQ
jgi:hypothetical protein